MLRPLLATLVAATLVSPTAGAGPAFVFQTADIRKATAPLTDTMRVEIRTGSADVCMRTKKAIIAIQYAGAVGAAAGALATQGINSRRRSNAELAVDQIRAAWGSF